MLKRIEKKELIHDLDYAIRNNSGFAFGKIGFSEQCILGYLPMLDAKKNEISIKAYETVLRFHCERQTGIFPTDRDFLKLFSKEYSNHVQQLDVLGIFGTEQEEEIINKNKIKAKLIPFRLTEPDQSIPYNPELCYLPLLENKKILLVSPFANLLKTRGTKEIFENVWAKTTQPWFSPQSIDSIEFPYAYITEKETHKKFGNVINLFNNICNEIKKRDFDIALIGAGALGIPLASFVKQHNKIGISLGGHLQTIFGIAGKRWKDDPHYRKNLINEAWIDMPSSYHPKDKDLLTDGGAYW